MTVVDDSERGTVRLWHGSRSPEIRCQVKPAGLLEDAYISAGNNPDGYDSAQCNWLGVGKGYCDHAGRPRGGYGVTLTASIKLHDGGRLSRCDGS